MSNLLAIGTYNLELIPGIPTPVLDEDFPVTVHIKMAALDPAGVEGDDNEEPSTVRILKRTVNVNDYGDENSEDDMDLSDEEVEEFKPVSKKGKKAAAAEESDEEEEEDDDEDFEVEEYVLCTLSPKTGYQQTLDLVISSDEEIVFEVRGSYPVHLTGNYVEHPYDQQNSEDEEEEFDSEDDLEDELDSEIEEEIVEPKKEVKKVAAKKEEPKKEVKVVAAKKEEPKKAAVVAKKEEPKETKKRVAEVEEPKVAAKKTKKEEEVPVKKAAKVVVRKIEGGVSIEDRTVGQGPVAKKGSKVGVRYVGKLKNGKIFDSNTKGKPFTFNLGKGEVIKGWDVGVAGMAVNGERRIVIPAPYAYGKQALPGIPANSELTFDVKLVNIR